MVTGHTPRRVSRYSYSQHLGPNCNKERQWLQVRPLAGCHATAAVSTSDRSTNCNKERHWLHHSQELFTFKNLFNLI